MSDMSTNFNEKYIDKKEELKKKYLTVLNSTIKDVKISSAEKTCEILGDDFFNLFNETEDLKELVQNEKKQFYKTDEYKTAQKTLTKCKSEYSKCKDDKQKESLSVELNKAISKITTLNITINNRLKEKTDKIKINDEIIIDIISKNCDKLNEIKDEMIKVVKVAVQDCIKNYSEELKVLSNEFGYNDDKLDLPFENEVIKIELPLSMPKRKETSDIIDDKQFIKSINNNKNLN